MSYDDPFAPFGEDDKTVLRPMPGGRQRPEPTAVPQPPAPPEIPEVPLEARRYAVFGDNPLISAALSVLSLVSRLRNLPSHPAITDLQQRVVKEIQNFENRALQQGVKQEHTRLATYALCSLVDETVLNTPWGAQSFWAHQSLLVIFHRETWGGEKVFQFLDQLVRQPAQNLYLIELFWLCLSLGFEGKYRIKPNGLAELEHLRSGLYQLIQRVRGDFDPELSIRWRGLQDVRSALVRYVPLWVVAAAAGVVLIVTYLGFAWAVNRASEPMARAFYGLARESVPLPPEVAADRTVAPQKAGRAERFRPLLVAEIAKAMVEVVDDEILRIRNSFASGSDRVKPEFVPMLRKIAEELEKGGDRVLVTGHTDNVPILSARFPSNFELSSARARHVAQLLESSAHLEGKVRYEGRSDYEPLVPNDSAENRAVNRRVDLLLH